jgi:hypothetical protein
MSRPSVLADRPIRVTNHQRTAIRVPAPPRLVRHLNRVDVPLDRHREVLGVRAEMLQRLPPSPKRRSMQFHPARRAAFGSTMRPLSHLAVPLAARVFAGRRLGGGVCSRAHQKGTLPYHCACSRAGFAVVRRNALPAVPR